MFFASMLVLLPTLHQAGDGRKGLAMSNTTNADDSNTDPQSTRISRQLQFDPSVRVFEVKHVADMNDDEISSQWLTDFDYQRIRADLKYTIHMMACGGEGIEEHVPGICVRGLECKTKLGNKQKRAYRSKALNAVLGDHEQHRDIKHSDEEIAERYRYATAACLRGARERGLRDESSCREEEMSLHSKCQLCGNVTKGKPQTNVNDIAHQGSCCHDDHEKSAYVCIHYHIPKPNINSTRASPHGSPLQGDRKLVPPCRVR
eukprot:Nitzschia sp. Nitz4//scaffold5_size260463//3576//4355//NITZ4_000933-RA/size260463-processed-gene-0.283-mRNA-1//1//CDS//3329555193//81//frame0